MLKFFLLRRRPSPLEELTREIRIMSQATDALTAAVAALTTSVDALIAKAGQPPEDTAAITAATTAVTDLKSRVDAAVTPPA